MGDEIFDSEIELEIESRVKQRLEDAVLYEDWEASARPPLGEHDTREEQIIDLGQRLAKALSDLRNMECQRDEARAQRDKLDALLKEKRQRRSSKRQDIQRVHNEAELELRDEE